LEKARELFRSNLPKYFGSGENPDYVISLLYHPEHYYLIEISREVVGAGGFGLNNDNSVSLYWRMVHDDHLALV
jgi:hypothetical protein